MKKAWKALVAVLATVAMAIAGFAGASTAFAAETYAITINQTDAGHTYEAYQVFTGDLAEDGTLSNVQWGAGVNGDELLEALKADTTVGQTFANASTAADVAAALKSDNAAAFAKIAASHLATVAGTSGNESPYTIGSLSAGYYLVKDKDGTLGDQEAAYTEYILKVVKNETVDPKGTVPTVEKKVKDTDDSTGKTTDWQDSADYDVNDTIPYQLTGTLSDKYADYGTYAYKFTDTLSKGLTLNTDSIKVYAVNGEGDAQTKVEIKKVDDADTTNTGYKVSTATYTGTGENDPYVGGTVLTVDFTDLKKAAPANATDTLTIDANTKIVVEYNATLNSNAIIGSAGNPNKVDLTFANNPYGEGTGKTPEDKVTVFTFKIVANKVDGQNKALKGAGFTLYKYDATAKDYVAVGKEIKGDDMTTFSFDRLDAGQYKLAETTTPTGYNTWAGLEFKVVAEHEETSNDPQLTTLKVTDLNGKDISSGDGKTFTIDMTAGSATMNVVNEKGSTLPSTGGMGTTILYAAGIVLVLAAGLWFGLRRRNGARR